MNNRDFTEGIEVLRVLGKICLKLEVQKLEMFSKFLVHKYGSKYVQVKTM